MLSARNVISTVVLVAVASILGSLASLSQPADNGGIAADSFGTRSYGLRAAHDLIAELKLPIDRLLTPPPAGTNETATIVLWEPRTELVANEPAYLQQLGEWVTSGGRVVVAPDDSPPASILPLNLPLGHRETNPIVSLGLDGVEVQHVDLNSPPTSSGEGSEQVDEDEEQEPDESELQSNSASSTESQSITLEGEGTLADVVSVSQSLALPEGSVGVLKLSPEKLKPTGRLFFRHADQEHVFAASFRHGAGEIVVVAEPDLITNRWLARGDNAALAVRLLASGRREVVWDEFYHGSTMRGNPGILLARPPYSLLVLIVGSALGAWAWRQGVVLGPPIAVRAASRRSLGEYVEAMSRLFARSRGGREFVLREVRSGVLWTIRRRLGLSPHKENAHDLAAVVGRKNPAAARQLTESIAALDLAIDHPNRYDHRSTIELLQKVSACL